MTFVYTIASIPTVYNGVQFRSRLEARWAAFFDIVGWKWSYEPLDFSGWIPDFVIHGDKERILVEVKPIFKFQQWLGDEMATSALRARSNDDLLILGAELPSPEYWGCVGIGWLGEYSGGAHGWATAIPHGGGRLGFCSETFSYRNRITGSHRGDDGAGSEIYDRIIEGAWKMAGNIVQWKSPVDGDGTGDEISDSIAKYRSAA